MKKTFLSFIVSTSLICILTISNLQAQSYEIGTNVINAGLGLGYSINYGLPKLNSVYIGYTKLIVATEDHELSFLLPIPFLQRLH